MGIELVTLAYAFIPIKQESEKANPSDSTLHALSKSMLNSLTGYFKDYNRALDLDICKAMLRMYKTDKNLPSLPDVFKTIDIKFGGNTDTYAEYIFEKSLFADKIKADAFLISYTPKKVKKLKADPGYILMMSLLSHYQENYSSKISELQNKVEILNRRYMKAQMEMQKDKIFYPDANSTLRVAWGKVEGYKPNDGAEYKWYTTLDGVMEKYKPGDEEFDLPLKLIELWQKKDYGQWGKGNVLRTCFIASNHTTGGNSGSPVLNADGELIGLNFDRCWEGTMSDIIYNPDQCRNISVDINYVMFVIDKFAGAGNIVKEIKGNI